MLLTICQFKCVMFFYDCYEKGVYLLSLQICLFISQGWAYLYGYRMVGILIDLQVILMLYMRRQQKFRVLKSSTFRCLQCNRPATTNPILLDLYGRLQVYTRVLLLCYYILYYYVYVISLYQNEQLSILEREISK